MAETTGQDLEARLLRLEAIVDALERDELELEAALSLFEEGVGHLRGARDILKQTELRVEKLLAQVDDDVDGQADGA